MALNEKEIKQKLEESKRAQEAADAAAKSAQSNLGQVQKEVDSLSSSYEKNIEKMLRYLDRAEELRKAGFKRDAKKADAEARALDGALNRQEELLESAQAKAEVVKNEADLTKKAADQAKKDQEELKGLQEKAAKAAKEHKKALAQTAKSINSVGKVLGILPGIGSALSSAMGDAAAEFGKAGDSTAAMKAGVNSIAALMGPAAILGSAIGISKEIKELSKDLGVSMDSAREIRKEFAQIADKSEDSRVNTERLLKANKSLNSALGLSVKYSGESLTNFIDTTRYLGASEEAAANLEKISAATGVNAGELKEGLALAAVQSGKNYGITLPLSKVVEKIKDMQGATLAYIADQPEELVKAVAISEKLGMSFSKIRSIADGMLDFQSSITNEVEAEVLLGRDINLNKARQLAFLGKEAELGKEVLKQVGSLSEYNAMLPVQQEAFAKALGMSRDEMANVLMRQELVAKFGEQAKDYTTEQLQAAKELADADNISTSAALVKIAEERDAAMAFEDAADKLKNTFRDLVVKLEPMVTKIAKVFAYIADSGLAKVAMVGVGAVGLLSAASKLGQGTFLNPMIVKDISMGGAMGKTGRVGVMGMGRNLRGKRGLVQGRKLLRRIPKGAMKGVGIGAVAALGGMAVDHYANKAVDEGNEDKAMALGAGAKALEYGGIGAMVGSVIPVVGTAVGAAVGASIGGVVGAMQKQEAVRQMKLDRYEEEKANQTEVVREMQMMRQALSNNNTTIEMDGLALGTLQANRPYNEMNKPILS